MEQMIDAINAVYEWGKHLVFTVKPAIESVWEQPLFKAISIVLAIFALPKAIKHIINKLMD